jgi:hypothetical protein
MPVIAARFFLLLLVLVAFSGCYRSLTYISDVDSIALTDSSIGKRYLLVPGNQNVTADDLEFNEYARYVDRILAPLGFSKAAAEPQADVAIFLSYGVGDPQTHQYSTSIPVYGQTGVSSSMTTGTITPMGGGMASYSGTTNYTPTYGVTGYQTRMRSYTTYTRFLQIAAYDLASYRHERKQRQVWKTTAISVGRSNDLRLVFPYMVAAVKQYVAGNTGKSIRVELAEDDPSATLLSGKSRD